MFPNFGMKFSPLFNRFLIYKMRILPWKSTGQKSRKWRMRSRSSWRRSAGWRILWRRPRRTPPTLPVMKLVSGPGALRRRIVLHVGCTGGYLSQKWNYCFFGIASCLIEIPPADMISTTTTKFLMVQCLHDNLYLPSKKKKWTFPLFIKIL